MKIAILSAFYPYRGGISQFSGLLFRALEKDHEVKAYTFSLQYPNFLFPGKTQFTTDLDNADPIPSTRVLNTINPFSYLKTAKEINSYSPQLLIIRFWMPFFGPALGTVAKKINPSTKIIGLLDNVIPHEKRFFDKPFTKYFLNKCDGFIVMTDAVKEDLFSLTDPNTKYIKISHPVYNHFGRKIEKSKARELLKVSPSKKTLLFFGFIRDYKGLDVLLKAFAQLDDTYQLIIAGECYGSFEKYQNLIDQVKNKDNIYLFDRYINDSEVSTYFSAADVCVLPYKSATQSGITAIANHFEVPVIATDVGGLKEDIENSKTGIIVFEPEPLVIVEAIEKYFAEGLEGLYSKNIAEKKEANSWDAFAEKVVGFSKEL